MKFMPGRLFEGNEKMGSRSWHRGSSWRVWSPDGSSIPGGTREVTPDLMDAVTVAALAGEKQ